MYRALLLTFAFGLTPALAEDIDLSGSSVLVEDFALVCDGPCPEAGPIAMSSDEDGDGEAEFATFLDAAPCSLTDTATCELQADASALVEIEPAEEL